MDNGMLFDPSLQARLREQFCFVDTDPTLGRRLFFDNSGGALRLARAVETKAALERYPDCPERTHTQALALQREVTEGTRDILSTVFGARGGALITELTASQTMFHAVGVILENARPGNVAVSAVEHPSAFDAVAYHAQRTGRELRVLYPDKHTGQITPEEVSRVVDSDTVLISVMAASNVTGSVMELAAILAAARQKSPDIFTVSDAVQHAPHAVLDVEALALDVMSFAPYKFFGVRGCGYAYVSDRVAAMPHQKLLQKPQEVFALGTPAPGNFAAMRAVIDYVCALGADTLGKADRRTLFCEGMRRIHLHEQALLHRLLEGSERAPGLRHIEGVTVHVDGAPLCERDLILGISVDGYTEAACVAEYERRGVIVCDRSRESMYARRILEALDVPGAVRVSPLHCHGAEDIDTFLCITAQMAAEKQKENKA